MLVPGMPASDESSASHPFTVYDSNDFYDSNELAGELMMPTGEPAAAVIGACLLLGMIWFFASGHFNGGAQATHAVTAEPRSLNASGGPVPPPPLHRSAG